MGIRGEVFSKQVTLPNRTYFFNIKENRLGDLYLNIVESKNRDTGGFERQSIVLFAEDLQVFLKGFDESLHKFEDLIHKNRRSDWNDDGARGKKHEQGSFGEEGPRPAARKRSDSDEEPRQYRKKPSERDSYPSGERKTRDSKRAAERGSYPPGERKRPSDRDGFASARPRRSSERDAYPPRERKRPSDRDGFASARPRRSAERDSHAPYERKRSPKGADQFDRPARPGKRVVVKED